MSEDYRQLISDEHYRQVKSLAGNFRRFFGCHDKYYDLVQIGNEALLIAAKHFDHKKKSKFGTYAYYYVKWAMFNYAKNESRYCQKWTSKINTAILECHDSLMRSSGRMPTTQEIAKATKLPEEEVEKAVDQLVMQCDKANPEDIIIKTITLKEAMRGLPPQYIQVIEMQLLETKSIKEISKKIGKTQEATKQLCYRARKDLRKVVQEQEEERYEGDQ